MSDLFDEALLAEEPAQPASPRVARRDRAERRRKRRRRTAIAVTISLLLVVGLAVVAYQVIRPFFDGSGEEELADYPGPGSGQVTVVIEQGATGADMGGALTEAGVVASQQAFVQAFNANPDAPQIQPGTYELMAEMRAEDAVSALLNPANKSEFRITIPEGFRATQILDRIANIAQLSADEVEAAAADTEALGLPEQAGGSLEGWLAPATYAFDPDADATEILSRMVQQTVSNFERLGVPAEEQQDILIKASIIDHEVNQPDDYGKVARVIENRLMDQSDTNGLLQMDSTVSYGLDRPITGFDLTREELRDEDNPYNTYRHVGLPPTPIGAPSPSAIEAVLDPPEGDWLYFVTVNPDTGETRFTGDHDEHNRNVEELREWRREVESES